MMRILAAVCIAVIAGCGRQRTDIDLGRTVAAYLAADRLGVADSLLDALAAARPDVDSVYARLAGPGFPDAAPGHRSVDLVNGDGKTRAVGIHVPYGYDPARPYPLMVWLHGGVNGAHPRKGARAYRSFMRDTLDADRFALSVTGETGATWFDPQGMANIAQALTYVKARFNIDDDRVVLAGISDGGSACYVQGNLNAGPYAGFACMSAFPALLGKLKIPIHPENMRQRRWYVVHSGHDRLYPESVVREYVKFFTFAGVPMSGKFYPEAGHDLGDFRDDALPYVYAWMDTVRRTLPDTLDWSADMLRFGRFEWVQVEEVGGTPNDFRFPDPSPVLKKLAAVNPGATRIRATHDGNTVYAFTRNVRKFSVLVSPAMFDLRAKLMVYANGALVYNGRIEPDPAWMLRDFRQYRDRKRIFAARVVVDAAGE